MFLAVTVCFNPATPYPGKPSAQYLHSYPFCFICLALLCKAEDNERLSRDQGVSGQCKDNPGHPEPKGGISAHHHRHHQHHHHPLEQAALGLMFVIIFSFIAYIPIVYPVQCLFAESRQGVFFPSFLTAHTLFRLLWGQLEIVGILFFINHSREWRKRPLKK